MNLTRRQYAEMFGPTVGDKVRLADTDLFVQVERDLIAENGGYGNEVKFGGGKVIRDGMAQSPLACDEEVPDLVITNAVILDAAQGREVRAVDVGSYVAAPVSVDEGFAFLGHYGGEALGIDDGVDIAALR